MSSLPPEPSRAVERLVVCGVGLIGASLALAARRSGWAREVRGLDTSPQSLEHALAVGALDSAGELPADLGPDDLVVIATPTLAVAAVITRWGGSASEPFGGAVVTDTASVKGWIAEALREELGALPARFVPGHPIAGSERSGALAADAALFHGHRVVLTPETGTDTAAIARVRALWGALGAEVCEMNMAAHDRLLAMTSHLPHLLSFALVDALGRQPEAEAIGHFAAGGFRDFTRIAGSDPRMWSDIFAANADALLPLVDDFRHDLDALRARLAAGDRSALLALCERARAWRARYLPSTEAAGDG